MKLRFRLLLLLLLNLSLDAAETKPARQLIVAAVGDIPVPRLKVTEVMGRRGYEADEDSTQLFFPKSWDFQFAGTTTTLDLGLNREPSTIALPEGITEMTIRPSDGKQADLQQKPKAIPAPAPEGPSLLIVFNREPNKPWTESHSSVFTTCTPLDPSKPQAMVLNLSGANVTFMGQDHAKYLIAPGRSALAPILVNRQQNIKMLPLSASTEKKDFPLDICPIDTRGATCPVVVVYPSITVSKQARPLKTSVIQPSDAAPLPKSALAAAAP